MQYRSKQVAAIHDLSGFGRCSLTAAIPILSAMGLHCCPMPSAILSSQTGYPGFTCFDFTKQMPGFIRHWEKLGLEFDTIYTGFLGGPGQINIVADFIRRFRRPGTLVAVDPVLGDNGAKYPGFSDEMCEGMKELVRSADIVFPNLTEAALLTGTDLQRALSDEEMIPALAGKIAGFGPKTVVITGAVKDDTVTNLAFDFSGGRRFSSSARYNHKSYSGTGDLFASVVCGGLTRGESLGDSIERAARFIETAVEFTDTLHSDTREGVVFEPFLKELIKCETKN